MRFYLTKPRSVKLESQVASREFAPCGPPSIAFTNALNLSGSSPIACHSAGCDMAILMQSQMQSPARKFYSRSHQELTERGFNLISDALPFGRLSYSGQTP